MKVRRIISFLLTYMLITACEESIDHPLSTYDTGLIAVEGILTNENKNHLILLTHPYKTLNGNPEPATGALLTLSDENESFVLTETPLGSGVYYTPVMRAVLGKVYTLSISYQNKEYVAQDSAVPVEPLQALRYEKEKDQYALVLEPVGQDPNFISHTITWKHTSACMADAACEGDVLYYDLKTIDVNEIYKPEKEKFYFPSHSVIIRRKYSVSPAYKSFLRSLLSETEWKGGLFDIERADVPTNLSVGAIGFFAVSTVISDTTIVVQ